MFIKTKRPCVPESECKPTEVRVASLAVVGGGAALRLVSGGGRLCSGGGRGRGVLACSVWDGAGSDSSETQTAGWSRLGGLRLKVRVKRLHFSIDGVFYSYFYFHIKRSLYSYFSASTKNSKVTSFLRPSSRYVAVISLYLWLIRDSLISSLPNPIPTITSGTNSLVLKISGSLYW